MISIKQFQDTILVNAAVRDFADSIGYCQYKIPLSIQGVKGKPSKATMGGAKAHLEEEIFEQEHVELEPVTTVQIQDSKEDIEFAREYVFSMMRSQFNFPSHKVQVSLFGRIDKIMRSDNTLIVRDDKFTNNPNSYDLMPQPYPSQMLQVMTYLNSQFSFEKFSGPNDWFDLPHQKKRWEIRICSIKTREPHRVYSQFVDATSQNFLQDSLKIFASIAARASQPVHHNSKSRCDACDLKDQCEFRIR